MARKGLGKGLDSLIPDFYDEDFDSNSTQSLEDMLNDMEEKTPQEEENATEERKNIFEEIEEENDKEVSDDSNSEETAEEETDQLQEETEQHESVHEPSEDVSGDKGVEDSSQNPQKIQVNPTHVTEVKEIVNKNPRITLWSARSSAVFRYLRKTEPEFSISKEASTLIDEAVSKKYPEIWELFDEY